MEDENGQFGEPQLPHAGRPRKDHPSPAKIVIYSLILGVCGVAILIAGQAVKQEVQTRSKAANAPVIEDAPVFAQLPNQVLSNTLLVKVAPEAQSRWKSTPTVPDFGGSGIVAATLPSDAVVAPLVTPSNVSDTSAAIFRWYRITLPTQPEKIAIDAGTPLDTVFEEHDTASESLETVANVAAAVKQLPGVEVVEPEVIVPPSELPNDYLLRSSGNIIPGLRDLWWLYQIQAPEMWDSLNFRQPREGAAAEAQDTVITKDIASLPDRPVRVVTVAVLDTGLDVSHPDIANKLWHNPGEIPDNGIDDDGNSLVDDVIGWDFGDSDNSVAEDSPFAGHGTMTAGIVASEVNNDTAQEPRLGVSAAGITGTDSVVVMPLKVYASGTAGGCGASCALVYAADKGAAAASLSFHFGGQLAADAVDYATSRGTIVVQAAGNDEVNVSQFGYSSSALIIGATRPEDELPPWTNSGEQIDVVAPGSRILTLKAAGTAVGSSGVIFDKYIQVAGTSFATPQVAGLAALLRAYRPEWTNEQIRQVIRQSADDIAQAGFDAKSGYGRINARAAAALLTDPTYTPPSPVLTKPGSDSIVRGSVPFVGSVAQSGVIGEDFAQYSVWSMPVSEDQAWKLLATEHRPVINGELYTFESQNEDDGLLDFKVSVLQNDKVADFKVFRVLVDNIAAKILSPQLLLRNEITPLFGTAASNTSSAVFDHYLLEYKLADEPDSAYRTNGVTLTAGGTQAVTEGQLAVLDTSVLATTGSYDFRLTVYTNTGAKDVFTRSLPVFDANPCPAQCFPVTAVPQLLPGPETYQVHLQWQPATTWYKYVIFRCIGANCEIPETPLPGQLVGITGQNQTEYMDTNHGLGYQVGDQVAYEVRPLNQPNYCSVQNCQDTRITISDPTAFSCTSFFPGQNAQLTCTPQGTGYQLTLSWDDPNMAAAEESGWNVYDITREGSTSGIDFGNARKPFVSLPTHLGTGKMSFKFPVSQPGVYRWLLYDWHQQAALANVYACHKQVQLATVCR